LASLKGDVSDSVETFESKTTETPKPSGPKKRPVTWEFDLMGMPMKAPTGQFLTTYCVNLNKKAKDGKIDPVIGRDREIERIGKVFNRRRQNNVVVVGDKGSGKTVLCESLAWLIANNKAPYSLQDKTIFKLDISAMIAGTTYRGMFEERAKGVFNELQKQPNCILFIDDFHLHTTKRDNESSTDITPFLKEAVGDGSIKVITTCTQKGYHRKFDSDSSLASNFQRVDLNNLSDEEVKVVLMEVKGTYEKYHNITINEQIIDLCIKLCKKYVTDRDMPDSVIDLIDEIGANLSDKYQEPQFEKDYTKEREKLLKDKDKAIKANDFALIDEIGDKLAVLQKQHIAKSKKHTANNVIVTEEDVYNIISQKTNIPIQNLSDDDKKDLSAITDRLKQVVIGQDEAIDKICKVIKRKKLGLHTGRGTAIFLQGKTGCGKCVTGETTIKIRNKKTGIVETIAIEDFYKRLK
jgi:ATP-dependent Clp protease ATP-binding subunit ClpC